MTQFDSCFPVRIDSVSVNQKQVVEIHFIKTYASLHVKMFSVKEDYFDMFFVQ